MKWDSVPERLISTELIPNRNAAAHYLHSAFAASCTAGLQPVSQGRSYFFQVFKSATGIHIIIIKKRTLICTGHHRLTPNFDSRLLTRHACESWKEIRNLWNPVQLRQPLLHVSTCHMCRRAEELVVLAPAQTNGYRHCYKLSLRSRKPSVVVIVPLDFFLTNLVPKAVASVSRVSQKTPASNIGWFFSRNSFWIRYWVFISLCKRTLDTYYTVRTPPTNLLYKAG